MRIDRVIASAFGPFDREQIELAPGMSVLFGPNESGKSSWHAAIYAALCGMRRGKGRLRSDDQAFVDRHRPWDGAAWEVAATVTLEDGRSLELRHDLDGKVDTRITDLGTGADVSAEYIYDGAPDGAGLLGLTRDVMPSTIFVRQADILGVMKGPGCLQEQLQRAAATGGRDATAEEALRIIKDYRSANVGSEVRHSTKPLRSALSRLAECQTDLEVARLQHAEYVELLRSAQEAEAEADEARARLAVATALVARKELDGLENRLKRAEALAEGLPEEKPPEFVFGPESRALEDALAAFRNRPRAMPAPEGRTSSEIEAELAGLPDPPTGDTEVHESVARAYDDYQAAETALETVLSDPVEEPGEVDTGGASAVELRRLADELEVFVPEVDPELQAQLERAREVAARGPSRIVLALGGAIVLAGLGLLAAGTTAIGAVLAAVGGVLLATALLRKKQPEVPVPQLEAQVAVQEQQRLQAQGRVQRARNRVEELGLSEDPEELRRLARRLEAASEDRDRYNNWRRKVEARRRALEDAARAVLSALEERGEDTTSDPEAASEDRFRAYQGACRARAEQARQAGRRGDLESELEARRDVEAAYEENQTERARAGQGLKETAAAVGIDVDEAEGLAEAAAEWLQAEEDEADRIGRIRERWSELEGTLGEGETLESLRVSVEELRAKLPPLRDDWEEVGGWELAGQVDTLREEASELSDSAAELRGRASDRACGIRDVATAEEAFAEAEAELERVRALDAILDRTHGFLSAARDRVQRDIAPRLKAAVEDRLPAITDGRYAEALVNADTLNVKVRQPGGEWRDAGLLSHGTAEQIYLLLRIALAEYLAALGEPAPLVLDDVTVQCDATRTRAVLDLLLELSDERQIILFSQEQEVLEWAEERLTGEADLLIRMGVEVPA